MLFYFRRTCRCRAGISGDSPDRGCPASPGEEEKTGADHADGAALYAREMFSFFISRRAVQALPILLNCQIGYIKYLNFEHFKISRFPIYCAYQMKRRTLYGKNKI